MFQVEAALLLDDSSARFLLVSGRGHLGAEVVVFAFNLNDDSVLGHLLLDQDYFLHTLDDEVASWVVGAFFCFVGELSVRQRSEPAVRRAKHHRHVAQQHVAFNIDLVALCILNVNMDGS